MSPLSLKIGGYGPEISSHGSGLAAFRDHVESATIGEVSIEVIWNIMDHGRPNTDLLDLVETGEMFMCYFSTSYLGPRVNELNVLETPFLFPDLQSAHRSLDGRLGERLRASVRAETGFETLGFWDNGFRHVTNRLRPIFTPEDCRDLSVRIQPNPIHEELIRSWGAVPVAVELSEGIRLIQSRGVDAQENPLANTVAYGVDKVHPFVTMTGHLYGARGLFANRGIYQALSEDIRLIVDEAAMQAITLQRVAAAEGERELRRGMEVDGIEFVDPGPVGLQAFESVSTSAIAMAHDTVPRDLLAMVER
jgi:tripartite ATP-independent transporter DctP family solute receptor